MSTALSHRPPGRGSGGALRLRHTSLLFVAALALLLCRQPAHAQTLNTLYSFTGGNDGARPYAGLFQASDGALYGTTQYGGANYAGAVFKITTGGTFTSLYNFTGASDGGYPTCALVQAGDGDLYGTTQYGGGVAGGPQIGVVFKITTGGAISTVHVFSGGSDGSFPAVGLTLGSNGNLYGVTAQGGNGYAYNGAGEIFDVAAGIFAPFCTVPGGDEGSSPWGPLTQGTDGKLYGTAVYGGTGGSGEIFVVSTSGTYTPLYSFSATDANGYNSDGANPYYSGLVQASDGAFYGTATYGGLYGYGTIYKVTTNGTFTTLYSFTGGNDGGNPEAGLMQASDGNLYGTAAYKGQYGSGTLFKITTGGAFTLLYGFTGGNDGSIPYCAPIQGSDGNLYGTTSGGGVSDYAGTIFQYVLPVTPTVAASLSPSSPAATGWYNGTTGSPTLNITGSSITGITYTVTKNGTAGSPVTVSGSSATVTFPSDGVYSVAYYGSTSSGSNTGAQTISASIDTTPPTTYMAAEDNLVFLDPTDATSGVAATYYTIDSGAQQTYVDEIQLPQDNGIHTLTYWSVDVAGNTESQNVAQVDTRADTYVYATNVPGTTNVLGKTTFSASLTETDTNLPVAGQTLSFTLSNGTALGTAVTNSSGTASGSFTLPQSTPAGPYTFRVAFAGNATLKPSSDTGTVTVAAVATVVSASNRGSAGSPIPVGTAIPQLRAELTAVGGNVPLSGYTINYQMNGTSIGSGVTSGNFASISYTIPDTLPQGANTLTVSFAGSGSLQASTGTATFYIGKANTTMAPLYWSGKAGQLVALTATLTSQITHLGLAGKAVTFTVKGQTYTATTSANGIATIFYTLPSNKGTFTYTASFAGSTAYNAVSNIGYITVTN